MSKMKIAKRNPFAGTPVIHTPAIFGASEGKDFMYRIPVTGKRPIAVRVVSDRSNITVKDGILYGNIAKCEQFTVTVYAENSEGCTEKELKIVIEENGVLKTPLMGFTTWNAFGSYVTAENVCNTADLLISSGIADYGYSYVNVDSGWQKEYGGEFDAIMPNEKFPDMKAMYDHIHANGLRGGIYSTPMLTAWGCPKELESIPGCTVGEPDPRFPEVPNGGIGLVHKEQNNVRQWEAWTVDYLKYDWRPVEPINAELMRQALLKSKREFGYCVTVQAMPEDGDYYKANVNSYRCNEDAFPEWPNVVNRINTVDTWREFAAPGHFYDLDMLAVNGYKEGHEKQPLSDNEEIFAYTLVSFFSSPLQISTPIETLNEFHLDLLCNEEIIAVNQDILADYPCPVKKDETVYIYKKQLSSSKVAYAVFNLSEAEITENLAVGENKGIRDLWMKEDLECAATLTCKVGPHCARVFTVQY